MRIEVRVIDRCDFSSVITDKVQRLVRISSLTQLRVLRFGLLQDRNIRVRVIPQREEILIGLLGLGRCRPASRKRAPGSGGPARPILRSLPENDDR